MKRITRKVMDAALVPEADNANLRTALEDVARDCDAVVKVHLPDLRMQAMWMRGLVRHIAGEARAAARRGIL